MTIINEKWQIFGNKHIAFENLFSKKNIKKLAPSYFPNLIETDNLRFPLILKPAGGSGSKDVYKIFKEDMFNKIFFQASKSIIKTIYY